MKGNEPMKKILKLAVLVAVLLAIFGPLVVPIAVFDEPVKEVA